MNVVILPLSTALSSNLYFAHKNHIYKNITSFRFMNVSQDHAFIFINGKVYWDCYWLFCFWLILTRTKGIIHLLKFCVTRHKDDSTFSEFESRDWRNSQGKGFFQSLFGANEMLFFTNLIFLLTRSSHQNVFDKIVV